MSSNRYGFPGGNDDTTQPKDSTRPYGTGSTNYGGDYPPQYAPPPYPYVPLPAPQKNNRGLKVFIAVLVSIIVVLLIGGGVGFGILLGRNQRVVVTPASTTSAATPVPTSPASTQSSAPTPPPTRITVAPTTVTVAGTAQNGVSFTAQASGNYQITIASGAYSTYPCDQQPSGVKSWLTVVRLYKNKPIQWGVGDTGLLTPTNFDGSVGSAYFATEAEAAASQSPPFPISLQGGDKLIFVPVDEEGHYSDNCGQVVVRIALT